MRSFGKEGTYASLYIMLKDYSLLHFFSAGLSTDQPDFVFALISLILAVRLLISIL